MQEAARHAVVIERRIDIVGRHNCGQRQITAGDAFGQAQEVRRNGRLLVREKSSAAAAPDHDLVGDQVHVVAIARSARQPQVMGVVHRHAGGALHQRLHDQRGSLPVMLFEIMFERAGATLGVGARRLAFFREPPVRARHLHAIAQQRRVGVFEQGDVGDRQRAQRFAVIAVGEADEAGFLRPSCIAPEMEAHFQCNLDRRCTIAGVKAMAEPAAGQRAQLLRQLNYRLVREAGQHHVLKFAELRDQRRIDGWIRMSEEVDPPRADGVQVASFVEIIQPHTFAAGDRHQRQRLVLFHLRARVPHRGGAACQQCIVASANVHTLKDSRGRIANRIYKRCNSCKMCSVWISAKRRTHLRCDETVTP